MRHNSKTGMALFQIAAVVFFLNATFAYGACCAVPDDSGSVGDVEGSSLPCHTPDDDDGHAEPASDCCVTCFSMMAPGIELKAIATSSTESSFFGTSPPTSNGNDPPFRPPD